MCRSGKFNFIYRAFTVIIAAGVLLMLPVNAIAQTVGDQPCGGDDPTSQPCPLDSWVWLLVFAAVIFGTIQLYRRQKIQPGA